jgi:4-oxalocrotonate tautomerase
MPLIQVTILEGRSQEQKENFYQEVTRAAEKHLNVKPEQVRVVINEVPKAHWAVGGVSKQKMEENSK